MREILSISGEPVFDDRIVKIESHTYNPYANTTFGYSDEIRIPIQQQDLFTLPCESFLYVEEIRYELEGVEIDRNRNIGITSTIKNYASLTSERGKILKNAGWDLAIGPSGVASTGDFNFCVLLDTLLDFYEDYRRVVINARHELILIRARNDNCLISREEYEPRVELAKIQWRVPHVSTTKHSWAVKAATQFEKPCYVIFALQTGRKNVLLQDASRFDACNLTNVKLYLNSDFYPYDDMNLDFDKNKIVLYDAYARFRRT
ncbi:uncharacterized protein LOC112639839 [Camponotus floridanus]|uniref:uncharacterized protein LOC112639839 n=1 Tax=Camponotus floridanus TaxID=104421 RepID=UPI000DC66CE5|nr:uncharacterized protein LOC112639839 [Camponotus floridanus]